MQINKTRLVYISGVTDWKLKWTLYTMKVIPKHPCQADRK